MFQKKRYLFVPQKKLAYLCVEFGEKRAYIFGTFPLGLTYNTAFQQNIVG